MPSPPVAAYPGSMACCCLQLRRLRRPAPAPPPARVLLLLSPPRLRPVRASPGSPSFAGWSSDDGDADQSPLGFGPAGETAATESYPDHDSCKENSVTHDAAQPSSPTDCQDDNDSLNKGDDTDVLPTPLESSDMPGGADECEMEPPLQNPELVTNGDHIVSEQVHQFDYPIASDDGSQSLVSSPPLPISDEYTQDDFASPTKLDGADGIPDLETTSDSDPKMDLPENQHLDDTSISDAVVLESEGVVPIQEYPEDKAMYIDNVTGLAFDDVTPEDPDFPFIQGLAEAGLISSKLSRSDMNTPEDVQDDHNLFYPESPVSRQDLVSWKMALDKRQLPEVDRNCLLKASGYIDIDRINAAAWPALVADLGAGDQSITALAFGFTRLFQPDKPVTKGQAALAISTGDSSEMVLEELSRVEAEKIAEAAVNAHGALVAQVEKDLSARFERDLEKEREKIETLEKLAEEARMELDRLRAEREEEKNILLRGRAAVESEMDVLSKLRTEVEEQLQSVLSKKVEISFEKNRIEKLQEKIENDNLAVVQLQYELEFKVQLPIASNLEAWAEEEAKKAREHARALEEARNQWERQGIKVIVEGGLEDDASAGVTWANAGKEHPVNEAIGRAESLLEKLKSMSAEMKVRSHDALERVMEHVRSFIASLKQQAGDAREWFTEFGTAAALKASKASAEVQGSVCAFGSAIGEKASKASAEVQGSVCAFGSAIGDKSKRVMEDCKEGLEKFSHRFKTD
nr:unnamed protein product [Digitaria exilis]